MRLIDAELLNNFIEKWLSKKCDEYGNTTPNEWLNSLKRCVEEQPTAYSVDKVVAELEENASRYTKKYVTPYGNNGYKDIKAININKAIEIVKQGVVSDDVCEWKTVSDGEFIQNPHTKRLYSNEPSMQNVYCNTCGKKIKAVE